MSNENRITTSRIESEIEDIYMERTRYLLNTDDILEDILKKGYT